MCKSKAVMEIIILAAIFTGSASAQELGAVGNTSSSSQAAQPVRVPAPLRPSPAAVPEILKAEPAEPSGSKNAPQPATSGTTLAGPVTESYSGTSPALSISNSGTNRGISVSNSGTSNASSALYGETYGSGAGLTGFNYGTSGPASKFEIMNSQSAQPAVYATTLGTGPVVLATTTNSENGSPAIYGQNDDASNGIGVEGEALQSGVYGLSPGTGVYGYTNNSGNVSYTPVGVDGDADCKICIGVWGNNPMGTGTYGSSGTGYGVSGNSDSGVGVYGQSQTNTGVYGSSQSAVGVYGYSKSSWAGYFDGPIAATSLDSYSDRNAKRHFRSVDKLKILSKIDAIPVTEWEFKTDEKRRQHVGVMAQDFHAAFHLNGDDDKHINLSDLAGISLAAIQELHKQLMEKDSEIAQLEMREADLRSRLNAQSRAMERMQATVENLARGSNASVQIIASSK